MNRLYRNEHGVTAVVVALSSVLLFSIAAMAVDLGNAYARKRSVQSQADFAALAGGAGKNLPGPQSSPAASDPAVIAAVSYLNKNQPQNDASGANACVFTQSCVTAALVVDGNRSNGEVYYGHFSSSGSFVASRNELTVLAPTSQVDYGLAGVMGFTSTQVQARATVAIKSARLPSLPFYAYNGCDYGPQTISEPNNGHAVDSVLLANGTDNNGAALSSISPAQVAVDDTTARLRIDGTNLSGATAIGFFESGNSSAGPPPVQLTSGFTVTSTRIDLTVALPTTVASVQGVWYVRVKKTNGWSAVISSSGNQGLNAPALTVGAPILTCDQGSNSGNFGTLKLQDGGQSADVAQNIAAPLDNSLEVFPNAAPSYLCNSSTPGARLWPSDPTNCVGTKPGMAQDAATSGFVKGKSGQFSGLLTNVGPGTGCAPAGTPATKSFLDETINNDTLSCFFTSTTTNIGQIDSRIYTLPGPVFSDTIWKSPRMVFVPVLGAPPSNGASQNYEIIDFRPGFITDQTNSAIKSTAPTANNGLTLSSTGNGEKVQSVQVVFFNIEALPDPPTGTALTNFTGSGPRILRLVD